MGKFFKNIHGLFLSQATCLQCLHSCQVIFATTSQNFMVFQIRGHRFSIFGSSISAIFFRVNHPKLLHMKRNSFKTTIISHSMPYQSTTFQNKYVMGKFFKNIHGLFLSQATRQFPFFHANHFSYCCDNLSKSHGFYKIFGHRFPFLGQAFRHSFVLTIQNFSMWSEIRSKPLLSRIPCLIKNKSTTFLSKTINYLSKQICYGQILQKHPWVIFIASHSSVSMLTICSYFPCQPPQLLLQQPLKILWFL